MTQRLIILTGLPGSGKSTWAEHMRSKSPEKIKVINVDVFLAKYKHLSPKHRADAAYDAFAFEINRELTRGTPMVIADSVALTKLRQRQIAESAPHGVIVRFDVLATPLRVCMQRRELEQRVWRWLSDRWDKPSGPNVRRIRMRTNNGKEEDQTRR